MGDSSLALCVIKATKAPGEELNLVRYNKEWAVKEKSQPQRNFQELLAAKRQKNSALYKNKKLKIEIDEVRSEFDELKQVFELEKQKCNLYESTNKELRRQLAEAQLELEREKGRKNYHALWCRELQQQLEESRSALQVQEKIKQELQEQMDCLLKATHEFEKRTVTQLQTVIQSSYEFSSQLKRKPVSEFGNVKVRRMSGTGENNDDAQDELFWTEETRSRPNDDIEVDDSFAYPHEVCWSCEGFYGPCFGEHYCSTCHVFLFLDDINVPKNLFSEKSDDEDSGNDEPVEPLGAEGFQLLNSVPSSPGDVPSADDNAELVPQPLAPVLGTEHLAEHLALLTQPQPNSDTVLLDVFLYLNDLSLWAASRACVRWKLLVEKNFTNDQWRHFTLHRWRLFKPLYPVHDWAAVYADLVESSTCFRCLYRSDVIPVAGMQVNPWRSKRMSSEWKSLKTDPVEGIKATPLYRAVALDWCGHWQASITGPANSPYEGGIFYLHIQIPNSYPIEPPSVRFITKVFHPNVSRHGNIGLDCIQGNWSLALTIPKILISVQSLLTDPYCKVSMEPDVARIYQTDRQRFDAIARWWTWKYAMSDAPKPERNHSSCNSHHP